MAFELVKKHQQRAKRTSKYQCYFCKKQYDLLEYARCPHCGEAKVMEPVRRANYGNPNLERKAVTK